MNTINPDDAGTLYLLILAAILLAGLIAWILDHNDESPRETTEPGAGVSQKIHGTDLKVLWNAEQQLWESAATISPKPSSGATGDGPKASIAETPPLTINNAPVTEQDLINGINNRSNAGGRIKVKFNRQYHDEKDLAPSVFYETNRGMVVRMNSRIKRSSLVGCHCKVCDSIYVNQIWLDVTGTNYLMPTLRFAVSDLWASDCPTCMTLRGDYEAAMSPWAWSADQTSLRTCPTLPGGSNG